MSASDEQLVLEALDDSHPAFEQLVKQYRYPVLRTIASIISDEQAAQDVAQEAFLSAWSNLAKLKEKGVKLINEEPVAGAHGTRIAFLHPKGTKGVMLELVEEGEHE